MNYYYICLVGVPRTKVLLSRGKHNCRFVSLLLWSALDCCFVTRFSQHDAFFTVAVAGKLLPSWLNYGRKKEEVEQHSQGERNWVPFSSMAMAITRGTQRSSVGGNRQKEPHHHTWWSLAHVTCSDEVLPSQKAMQPKWWMIASNRLSLLKRVLEERVKTHREAPIPC